MTQKNEGNAVDEQIESILKKGVEHDGSFVGITEVRRLMREAIQSTAGKIREEIGIEIIAYLTRYKHLLKSNFHYNSFVSDVKEILDKILAKYGVKR